MNALLFLSALAFGDPPEPTYQRLFDGEAAAAAATTPSAIEAMPANEAPVPAGGWMWPSLLSGAGLVAAWQLRKRAQNAPSNPIRVVQRQSLGDRSSLVLVEVQDGAGTPRRLLVGAAGGKLNLVADLGAAQGEKTVAVELEDAPPAREFHHTDAQPAVATLTTPPDAFAEMLGEVLRERSGAADPTPRYFSDDDLAPAAEQRRVVRRRAGPALPPAGYEDDVVEPPRWEQNHEAIVAEAPRAELPYAEAPRAESTRPPLALVTDDEPAVRTEIAAPRGAGALLKSATPKVVRPNAGLATLVKKQLPAGTPSIEAAPAAEVEAETAPTAAAVTPMVASPAIAAPAEIAPPAIHIAPPAMTTPVHAAPLAVAPAAAAPVTPLPAAPMVAPVQVAAPVAAPAAVFPPPFAPAAAAEPRRNVYVSPTLAAAPPSEPARRLVGPPLRDPRLLAEPVVGARLRLAGTKAAEPPMLSAGELADRLRAAAEPQKVAVNDSGSNDRLAVIRRRFSSVAVAGGGR